MAGFSEQVYICFPDRCFVFGKSVKKEDILAYLMDFFRPFYITRRMPRHLPSLPMRNVIVTVNEQLLTYFLRIRKAIARMRTGRGARWLVAAPANHLAPSSASTSSAKVSEYNTTTYISYLQVSYSLILILLGSEHLISKIRFSIWMCFF